MKTKNNNKIQLFVMPLVIALLSLSCSDDFLESFPTNELSAETFYNSVSDYEKAINGAYRTLAKENTEFTYLPMLDCGTPYIAAGKARFGVWDYGTITANSTWRISTNYWRTYYRVIKHANEVLVNLENAPEGLDQASLDRIKGEALFLRGFSYFYLTDFFGDVPLITTVLELEEIQTSRTPKSQVIEQVIIDLEEAIDLLPSVTEYRQGGSLLGRASKGAAQGFLGKLLMFEERYAEAKTVLKALIDSGDYDLTQGPTGFIDQFWPDDENNIESIFEIQYSIDAGFGNRSGRFFSPSSRSGIHHRGFQYISPRETLLDLYETVNGGRVTSTFVQAIASNEYEFSFASDDPAFDSANPFNDRDPRLNWTAWYEGTPYIQEFEARTGQTGVTFLPTDVGDSNYSTVKYIVGKAYDLTGNDSAVNYKVLRYADILLLYAEALIENDGDVAGAATYINMVRSRESVNMPDVAVGTVEEMRTALREERIRELACEYGHIYQDMKRWGIYKEAMESFWTANKYGSGSPALGTFSSDYLLWPISQDELDVNPNMEQNPGY